MGCLLVQKLISYGMIAKFALYKVQKVFYDIHIDLMLEFGWSSSSMSELNGGSVSAHISCQKNGFRQFT